MIIYKITTCNDDKNFTEEVKQMFSDCSNEWTTGTIFVSAYKDNNIVAGALFRPVNCSRKYCESDLVKVNEGYRRQGIATKMYNLVESLTNATIKTMGHLSPDGEKFWNNRNNRRIL